MKKVAICGVAALAIMLAAMTGMAEEAKKQKARSAEAKAAGAATAARRAEKKEGSEAERQWREKLEAMTPEQRRVAIANKTFENELAPWKQVRALAVEEKAAKTIAEIDKIIAARTEQHKKRLEAMSRTRPAGARTGDAAVKRQQQKTEKKPVK